MTTELGLAVKRKSATPSSGTNIRRDHSIKEVSKLVDIDLCIGCKAREVACKEWNDLEVEETHNFGGYKSHEDLTASTWDLMRFNEVDLDDGGIAWHIRKDSWRGPLPAPKTPTSPRSSGTCAGASERRRQQGGVRGRPLYPRDRVAPAVKRLRLRRPRRRLLRSSQSRGRAQALPHPRAPSPGPPRDRGACRVARPLPALPPARLCGVNRRARLRFSFVSEVLTA
jgi:hypothetical protein